MDILSLIKLSITLHTNEVGPTKPAKNEQQNINFIKRYFTSIKQTTFYTK